MSIFGKLFKRRTNPPPADGSAVADDDMKISKPTNVKHEWHVGFDQTTGQISGLPPVWDAWLKNSDIRRVLYFLCLKFRICCLSNWNYGSQIYIAPRSNFSLCCWINNIFSIPYFMLLSTYNKGIWYSLLGFNIIVEIIRYKLVFCVHYSFLYCLLFILYRNRQCISI